MPLRALDIGYELVRRRVGIHFEIRLADKSLVSSGSAESLALKNRRSLCHFKADEPGQHSSRQQEGENTDADSHAEILSPLGISKTTISHRSSQTADLAVPCCVRHKRLRL